MELSKARPNQALTQHNRLSQSSAQEEKLNEIVSLLAKLGVRRQAKLAPADYLVFAEDLMDFEMMDIQSGLESLSSRPRNEGETAFPEVAVMVAEVQAAGRIRRIAEVRERRLADEAREAARRRTHPEEFEPIGPKDLEAMAAKLPNFDYERPKVKVIPEPKMEVCPHCFGVLPVASNMRFWTSKEIREYADLKEELELLADVNRAANKAHVEKCLAEQLANLPATTVPNIEEEL
jgi:hypothetical protein